MVGADLAGAAAGDAEHGKRGVADLSGADELASLAQPGGEDHLELGLAGAVAEGGEGG